MSSKNRWRLLAVVMSVSSVVLAAGIAFGGGVVTSAAGKSVTQVKVKRSSINADTGSTTFVNLPDASLNVRVPAGQQALLVARFTAQTACEGADTSHFCTARILVDGVEAAPVTSTSFRFAAMSSTEDGEPQAHAFDRSAVVGPGNHTIVVQYAVNGTGQHDIDWWHLTVERIQK